MNINQFIKAATQSLKAEGIETPRLDCLVLLEDVLGMGRATILAHGEQEIDQSHLLDLNNKIEQRIAHEPLAYIRGKAFFYGREFRVNHSVLVPRPETEDLVELVKALKLPKKPRILDIGTGSGCLGISLALEIKQAQVSLSDIDPTVLELAKSNAKKLNADVKFITSDLFEYINRSFDVATANLPYVPTNYPLNEAAKHEPKVAIFGGKDGLDVYREFWQQIGNTDTKWVLTESLPEQHKDMTAIALENGYKLAKTKGYAQQFNWLGQPQA